MSFAKNQRSEGAVDLQIQQFITAQAKKQQFQRLVESLVDICWETCMSRPTPILESKTEKCFVNCVERFIDTVNFITNRLQKVVSSD